MAIDGEKNIIVASLTVTTALIFQLLIEVAGAW